MDIESIFKELKLESFIAIDFETTGLSPYEDRVIEVAAIKYHNGLETDRYSTLVNPNRDISSLITGITSISNKMVRNAPDEENIIDDLIYFLEDLPLVAHNISFDWNVLNEMAKRYGRDVQKHELYDTLQLARSLLFDQPVFNLGALAEYYGSSSVGSHRAIKDTENCGMLFINLVKVLSGYSLEVISKTLALIGKNDIPNKSLYINYANALTIIGNLKEGLTNNKVERDQRPNTFLWEGSNNSEEISGEDVFDEGGLLNLILNNYEKRKNQIKYAKQSEKILNSQNAIGVIEAGTGLGKSISYLYSAFKRARQADEMGPVVIACHTKNLQDQLFYKDLPLLAKAMDIDISAVMLKGRKNYICKTRFDWLLSDSITLEEKDVESLLPVLFWQEWTKSGDISECSGFFNSRRTWLQSLICCDIGFCTGDICKRNHGCYYGNVRKVLFQAPIIIANHSLLLTEAERPGFLPEFDTVIVDEAHNLIKSAYDQFKISLTPSSVSHLLQNIDPSHRRSKKWNNMLMAIDNINKDIGKIRDSIVKDIKTAQDNFLSFINELSSEHINLLNLNSSYQEKPIIQSIDLIYDPVNYELELFKGSLRSLHQSVERLRALILKIDPTRKDFKLLHSTLEQGVENITSIIIAISSLTENQDYNWVYWMEGSYNKSKKSNQDVSISLFASPIDVSENLYNKFFDKLNNCLLTSATLKVDDSFDYFLNRVGISNHENLIISEYKSPFLYQDQVKFYQYGGLNDISGSAERIADIIHHLYNQFNQRIMVLFTSVRLLSDTAKILKLKSGGRDLPLFAQVSGASKPAIINGMLKHKNGILFGTNSFWEGVDLPGELLEILVLVKLPFDVPSDPLIKSYSESLNQNGANSFMEYSVPECVIKYKQGFGRLIRTSYDSGLFISLDNRIINKRYGGIFLESIPVNPKIFEEYSEIK